MIQGKAEEEEEKKTTTRLRGMAADLVPTLLQFQPGAVQLKSRREYDHEARSFAVQLANLPAALWPQDVEAEQRVLGVCSCLFFYKGRERSRR